MRIALDAMGGDFAPKNNVEGAVLALKEYPQVEKLFLVGDAVAIGNELKRIGFQDERIEIFHASQVVEMKDSAAKAIRQKKDSSISRSVDLVKNGSAHAVVSAGHTGAAVAASVLKLRTLTGIERPAVACLLPTEKGVFVLCVFAEQVLGLKRPTVGLLSIGEEDVKGNDTTKEAFKLLKSANLNFRGNVEGHDLYEHGAEVVVCDGFVGNIVLKTSESIAYAIFGWLRRELTKSFIRKLGAQLARGAFRTIYKRTNSEEYGGMPLLGVNGTCIIAHGSSSPVAIKNAIRVAAESIQHDLNPQIIREIQAYNDKFATASTAVQ